MPPLILASALLEGLALTLIQGYLPLYVRQTLGEPHFVTVALVVAVPALGTAIAGNFWGGLSDVSGKLKPMVLIGLVGYAGALAWIPTLRQGFVVLLYVGAASLLFGTLAPSLKTYVTLLRPDRKEHSLAYLLMSQSCGWLLGSFGAGWLLEGGIGPGLHLALWTCAALLAAHAVLCAFRLRDLVREPIVLRDRLGWLEGLMQDLRSLYENPKLLRLCILSFLFVSGNYTVWGFFAVYLVERLGADIQTLRYALAASATLGLAAFLFVGPLVRRFGGRAVLAVGLTLYLLMYLGMGLSRSPLAVAAFFAIPLYGMVNVSTNSLASEYSSAGQRGGGLGVLSGAYALASIAGPVTGGLLADRFGLGVIPWVGLAFMSVAGPLAWAQVVAGRRKPA